MRPIFSFPAALLLAAAITPATAAADGLPVPYEATGAGVAAPGGGPRYFTTSTSDASVVVRISEDGERIERQRTLPARAKGVPAPILPGVALDGTVSGLSADGGTLVLIEPRRRFPRSTTRLIVLDANRLRPIQRIRLEGDFSFDAISPDGSVVYLVNYVDRRDPTRYEVRAYDVEAGRLRPDPIVDSETAEITMRGLPQTRVTSPDGAWEYTLYDGNGKTPFVHGLNVEDGTSVCIDVTDYVQGSDDAATLALSTDGSMVVLHSGVWGPAATIDRASFEVTDIRHVPIGELDPNVSGSQAGETQPAEQAVAETGGEPPLFLVLLAGLAALCAATSLLLRRRRRRMSVDLAALDFEPEVAHEPSQVKRPSPHEPVRRG